MQRRARPSHTGYGWFSEGGMGWIADTPGFKSFDRLANKLLNSGKWPDTIEKRALGNALRDVDKGQRRDWLEATGRKEALAEVLGLSIHAINGAVADHTLVKAATVIQLVDLPDATPLDLLKENLFPGIPRDVLRPARWQGTLWWRAPGGAGKTLVGRWLAARGLVRHERARDASALLSMTGGELPLYVELDTPEGLEKLESLELDGPAVCVAAPFDPPQRHERFSELGEAIGLFYGRRRRRPLPRPEEHRVWTVVACPPLEDWVDELLTWVADRLSAGTGFEPHAARKVIDNLKGLLYTPGDVLTVCGLVDQWGAEHVGGGDLRALTHALELAGARVAGDSVAATWVRENAADLITGIVRRIATARDVDVGLPELLESGLARAEWQRVLPSNLLPGPDVGAMEVAARAAATSGGTLAPETVLSLIRPGPDDVVRLLVESHLLESRGDGRLVFRMRWLMLWCWASLAAEATGWPVPDLGEVALRTWAVPQLVEELVARFGRGDWTPAARVVESFDDKDIARIAAMEVCFRAAGLAVLQEASISTELATKLWKLQTSTWQARDVPTPCVNWPFAAQPPVVMAQSAFLLAALAISENLPDLHVEGPAAGVAPWAQLEQEAFAKAMRWVDLVHHGYGEVRDLYPWAAGAYALGSRLFDLHGAVVVDSTVIAIQWPAWFVERVRAGDAPDEAIGRFGYLPLEILRDEARRRSVDFGQILAALWAGKSNSSNLGGWRRSLLKRPADAAALWPACPPERIESELGELLNEGLPLEALSDAQWSGVFAAIQKQPAHIPGGEQIWPRMPWPRVEMFLADDELRRWNWRAYESFWTRFPDRMRAALHRELASSSKLGGDLLWNAPDEEVFALVDTVGGHHDQLARRLHRIVERRGARWREAWDASVRLRRAGS